jgi:urease accessory protein
MSAPVRVHHITRAGDWTGEVKDRLTLDYSARFLRRKLLVADGGTEVLVDFAQTQSLDDGDAFELPDGGFVRVCAKPEPLLEVRGNHLPRLAWHIGNRHTPCQIEDDVLRIRQDKVMADMLSLLGADVTAVVAPFTPEGGAYGHGRTHGHSHHDDHDKSHSHTAHSHHHDHAHDHDHGDHDHHHHGHDHDHGHSH